MSRNALIVIAASTMALGGSDLHSMFTNGLLKEVNYMVTGEKESPVSAIDKNLVLTQVVMSAIDNAQGLDVSTKQLFHGWLKYGLATMFSLAVLSFMTSVIMELMLRVAVALWSANAINGLLRLGDGGAGLTSQAMQQGGIGLLMTVLLVTAPPMAASFFGATIGQFSTVSQVSAGAGAQANASGMPGQVGYQQSAGTAPERGGEAPSASNRLPPSRASTEPPRDEVRTASAPPLPPSKALKVNGEAG